MMTVEYIRQQVEELQIAPRKERLCVRVCVCA